MKPVSKQIFFLLSNTIDKMKLTIAFLSILLVANPSVTAEKRRNLDEEEERYDGPHSVDRLKMDHDYLSKP
jgi:hypothetical protein